MNAFNNIEVVTLSSLLAQDSPQAYMLPERPSTFNQHATFLNDEKYLIHDYCPNIATDSRHMKAMRACPVAGNELPILLTRDVNSSILQHWSKWLPFFPKPDIRIFDDEDIGEGPLIVNFPFQSFPAKKHAVEPDIHYGLSSKTRIPEMGAPCPRYMSRDNYTLPCMIKATQGVGGRGVFLARTKDQAQEAFGQLERNFGCSDPVITEVIEGVSKFLNVQLYLAKNGESYWLGIRSKTNSMSFDVTSPDVDWKQQEVLKELTTEAVFPVTQYLHRNGYFGFTGVEILVNNHGKYLIDVNLKTSDSTYLLLLAPCLAALGYFVSKVMDVLPSSLKLLLQVIDDINRNEEGRVIILSGDDHSADDPLNVCAVVFAKNTRTALKLQCKLIRACGLKPYNQLYADNRKDLESCAL